MDGVPSCIYCYSYNITLCQGRPGPVPGDTPAPGHVAGGRPQQTGEKREHGTPQYLIFDLQCSVIFIQKDVDMFCPELSYVEVMFQMVHCVCTKSFKMLLRRSDNSLKSESDL